MFVCACMCKCMYEKGNSLPWKPLCGIWRYTSFVPVSIRISSPIELQLCTNSNQPVSLENHHPTHKMLSRSFWTINLKHRKSFLFFCLCSFDVKILSDLYIIFTVAKKLCHIKRALTPLLRRILHNFETLCFDFILFVAS